MTRLTDVCELFIRVNAGLSCKEDSVRTGVGIGAVYAARFGVDCDGRIPPDAIDE